MPRRSASFPFCASPPHYPQIEAHTSEYVFPNQELGLQLDSGDDGNNAVVAEVWKAEVKTLCWDLKRACSSSLGESENVADSTPHARCALYDRPAGDLVAKINGKSVVDDPFEAIVAELKAAPRPVTLAVVSRECTHARTRRTQWDVRQVRCGCGCCVLCTLPVTCFASFRSTPQRGLTCCPACFTRRTAPKSTSTTFLRLHGRETSKKSRCVTVGALLGMACKPVTLFSFCVQAFLDGTFRQHNGIGASMLHAVLLPPATMQTTDGRNQTLLHVAVLGKSMQVRAGGCGSPLFLYRCPFGTQLETPVAKD